MRTKRIAEGITRIYEPLGVYMFLIEGRDRALLLDTGYGVLSLKRTLKRLTDKEILVVNTHGHLDHNGGNGEFPMVYQSDLDREVNALHIDHDQRQLFVEKFLGKQGHWLVKLPGLHWLAKHIANCRPMTLVPMPEEFDLGDRKITVIPTPGHTPGSVCFLDEDKKLLFTGDTVCDEGVLLMCDYSLSVQTFKESILRLKAICEEKGISILIPSHHRELLDPSFLDSYLALCDDILDGKEKGTYVESAAGNGWKADRDTISITYQKLTEE